MWAALGAFSRASGEQDLPFENKDVYDFPWGSPRMILYVEMFHGLQSTKNRAAMTS